jgi:hypothetical protein
VNSAAVAQHRAVGRCMPGVRVGWRRNLPRDEGLRVGVEYVERDEHGGKAVVVDRVLCNHPFSIQDATCACQHDELS